MTLTTNATNEFAGRVGSGNKLMAQVQIHGGRWSEEMLLSHENILPGEVVTQSFTTSGCPQGIRLINRNIDCYVFDTVTLEREGREPLVLAQVPEDPPR